MVTFVDLALPMTVVEPELPHVANTERAGKSELQITLHRKYTTRGVLKADVKPGPKGYDTQQALYV